MSTSGEWLVGTGMAAVLVGFGAYEAGVAGAFVVVAALVAAACLRRRVGA